MFYCLIRLKVDYTYHSTQKLTPQETCILKMAPELSSTNAAGESIIMTPQIRKIKILTIKLLIIIFEYST